MINFKNIDEVIKYLTNYNGEVKNEFLQPVYNTQKDYYKKAAVKTLDNNIKLLYSYNTLVCIIYDNKYILNDNINYDLLFSNTTLKHIKDFLLQNINILRLSHLIDSKITKKDIIINNNKRIGE